MDPTTLRESRRLYDEAKSRYDAAITGLIYDLDRGFGLAWVEETIASLAAGLGFEAAQASLTAEALAGLQTALDYSIAFQRAADNLMGVNVRGGGEFDPFAVIDSLLNGFDRLNSVLESEKEALKATLTSLRWSRWDELWPP